MQTFNFHDSDFVTSGKTVTYNVTAHPSWPGWTYYEYQWSQVHGTNYHWEGSVTCGNPEPEVVTGTATFQTLSCKEGAKNWAETDAVPGGVWTFTDKNGVTYKTATGTAYSGGVPGGLAYGDINVSLDDTEDTEGGPTGYDVTPWSGTWTTVDPASLDCNVEPEVVTGTATFQTLSCTEGSRNWVVTDGVPGGVWIFIDSDENRYVTEAGESYFGGVPGDLMYGPIKVMLRDADATDNYSVTPWTDTWTTVDPESLDCTVVIPPTEPPVVTPPVVTPPIVTPPALTPPDKHVPPAPPADDVLASTGTDAEALNGTVLVAALLLLAGAAMVLTRRFRRSHSK